VRYKKYPNYKDSGVEWLGEIPEHWEVKQGKHIGNILSTPSVSDDNLDEVSSILYIKVDDLNYVKSTCLTTSKHRVSNDFSSIRGISGFICFPKRGAAIFTNKACIVNIKSMIDPNLMGWKIFNKYNKEYILKLLLVRRLDEIADVSTVPQINNKHVEPLKFPIPPKMEQDLIANYLDNATNKIDTLITKQKRLIELLKEKRQALISKAVTRGLDNEHYIWNTYRLDWTSAIVRGNTGFKKDELLNNGKYVALQYGKTYKVDEVNKTFNFYVNNEFYKLSQIVNYGDTILISTSETVKDLGHSCFYNREDVGLIGGEQILLKPNSKLLDKKYLYYSSKIFSNVLKKYASGLKVFRFNTDDLKNIFISIPSVEEQKNIANYLDQKTTQIDILIGKSTKAITLLQEKRTALISSVVTGKIDVRGEYEHT